MTAQHWLWVSLACNLVLLVGWFLTLGWGESYRQANMHLQRRIGILTEDPAPICGCGHHISFHDEEGCHITVTITREAMFGPRGMVTTCPCVRYVGPEPLPRFTVIERPPEGDEPA
jgi:hypothetical protein